MEKESTVIKTPAGNMKITAEKGAITEIFPTEEAVGAAADSAVLAQAARELEEYFEGGRRSFTFPVSLGGSEFTKRVWEELVKIPFGERRSYGQLAAAAGSPKGARAAGGACGRNRVLIAVPCHRVVGASGGLTGFGGGLKLKEFLLRHESGEK